MAFQYITPYRRFLKELLLSPINLPSQSSLPGESKAYFRGRSFPPLLPCWEESGWLSRKLIHSASHIGILPCLSHCVRFWVKQSKLYQYFSVPYTTYLQLSTHMTFFLSYTLKHFLGDENKNISKHFRYFRTLLQREASVCVKWNRGLK